MTETIQSSQADPRAIGIFDSGLGGLTVARAIRSAFPAEAICYLGDTARVPYGTRSPETVCLYTTQDIAFLINQGVKIIVAACNTASAVALPMLQPLPGIPILGVVELGAEAALAGGPRKIGVIGTEATIRSGAYVRAIQSRAPEVDVIQKACPLFVPLIEELWLDHPATKLVIDEYLAPMRAEGVEVLILGCTHYPLLRPALSAFFGPDVRLVDSAEAMVGALRSRLADSPTARGVGATCRDQSQYYVTDRGSRFQSIIDAFMGEDGIQVRQISSEVLIEAPAKLRAPSAGSQAEA